MWFVCVSVCVFLYGDHKDRQRRVKKLKICALSMHVCVCGWVCLPDLISTARFMLLTVYVTSKRQKETDSKTCIRTNVFVIKKAFSPSAWCLNRY